MTFVIMTFITNKKSKCDFLKLDLMTMLVCYYTVNDPVKSPLSINNPRFCL